MQKLTLAVLLLLGFLGFASAGGSRVPLPSVTFYRDYGEQVEMFKANKSGNMPDGYKNMVSSLVVPPGMELTFYSDSNYTGDKYGPIGEGTHEVDLSYNDRAVSFVIKKAANKAE